MGTSPEKLRNQIEATRADMTRNVDVLADKVSPSAIAGRKMDSVREAAGSVKEKVMGAAHHGGDATSSLSAKASDYGSTVTDQVAGAPDAIRGKAQGNPLAAGIIAFGAGLLLSSLIPASDKEQRAAVALKEKAAPLADEAKAQALQLKDSLQPAAQDAVEQVKSTATEAASATKEQATSVAGEVADHAKSAAVDTKADVADHAAAVKDNAHA